MTADQDGPRGAHILPGGAEGTRRNLHMTLPVANHAVRLARQATCEVLATWRLLLLEETAVLLVSELVTNAVRHARGTDAISLELETAGIWLRIEVQDADPRWPQPRTPGGFDESGFGFVLVDALAGKWGVRETATGKAVWAELDTRPGGEPGRQADRAAGDDVPLSTSRQLRLSDGRQNRRPIPGPAVLSSDRPRSGDRPGRGCRRVFRGHGALAR
jgi:anti-sigma regulatory factor (Ser/Thr protein kinase)